jgi:hypothetical protein
MTESEMTGKVTGFADTPGDPICTVLRRYNVKEPEILVGHILQAIKDAQWCFGRKEAFDSELIAAESRGWRRGMEEAMKVADDMHDEHTGDFDWSLFQSIIRFRLTNED